MQQKKKNVMLYKQVSNTPFEKYAEGGLSFVAFTVQKCSWSVKSLLNNSFLDTWLFYCDTPQGYWLVRYGFGLFMMK